jgi:hypothetical protein
MTNWSLGPGVQRIAGIGKQAVSHASLSSNGAGMYIIT